MECLRKEDTRGDWDSLKDTLKYTEENNLYKRKGTKPAKKPTAKRPRKTKDGGSSGGILINERANAQLKGDVSADQG